ncbi:MAG TPA: family 43 glycosylhydrolase, partial [Anaerolineales bacterium]
PRHPRARGRDPGVPVRQHREPDHGDGGRPRPRRPAVRGAALGDVRLRDPHVFQDEDGARYLFYATDFLDYERAGTGTVASRLADPFTLAGQPQPVTRAKYDWQIYDPNRIEKGGVRWHTVEGPFVLKHRGLYYQMFSAGNWHDPSYGVGYATRERLDASGEWDQRCDGERVLPILRTLPDQGVIGPGHNSVARGPDNRQLWCVYHRWMPVKQESGQETSERVMAVDRLEWIGDRLAVLGPSSTPQPAPLAPGLAYFKPGDPDSEAGLDPAFRIMGGGRWRMQDGWAVQENTRPGVLSETSLALPAESFVLELVMRMLLPEHSRPGAYGFVLDGGEIEDLCLSLLPRTSRPNTATAAIGSGSDEHTAPLPAAFTPQAGHLFRLEVNGLLARLQVDGQPCWQGRLEAAPTRLALFTRGMAAAFSGLELTPGWQDEFSPPFTDLEALGWRTPEGAPAEQAAWQVRDGRLWRTALDGEPGIFARGPALEAYEWVVNLRLEQASAGSYGFYPALTGGSLSPASGPLLELLGGSRPWSLVQRSPQGGRVFELPPGFDPYSDQQFRFRKQGDRLQINWQAQELGETSVESGPCRVGLYARRAAVSVELSRVTAISP